jgi:methionine-rich copper-binding protein CopC
MKLPRLFLATVAATASVAVQSHAFLDHAEPKVGSVVAVAPGELRIWFTQKLEPAFSTAEVIDAGGRRVDTGRAEVDANDQLLLHVPLNKLGPGAYTANWRVVSVDTHPSEGRFTFRVGP